MAPAEDADLLAVHPVERLEVLATVDAVLKIALAVIAIIQAFAGAG